MTPGRLSYTLAEAAEVTGIGLTTIKAAIKAGTLEARYPTTKGIVTHAELRAWLDTLPNRKPEK